MQTTGVGVKIALNFNLPNTFLSIANVKQALNYALKVGLPVSSTYNSN